MASRKQLYPLVSVDVALFSVERGALRVLLVKRAQAPEIGRWALPGALLRPDEDTDLEATALRALRDKLDVDIPHLEQVRVFSGKDRDPRGWSVSMLFYALLPQHRIDAEVRSKVEAVAWVEADADGPGHDIAFDHRDQLEAALQMLRDKVEARSLPLHLMQPRFSLTELQRTCEAVLGHALDKSVFRRRLKGSPDLVELPEEFALGPQRPAQLFRAREGFSF